MNQICRALAAAGLVQRRPSAGGKIVNCLVTVDVVAAVMPSPRDQPRAPVETMSAEPAVAARFVYLRTRHAIQEFVYLSEQGVTEDQVKAAVQAALQADGWSVQVRWGRAFGIDMVALRGPERWVIEAKGEGSRPAMRVNYFLGALGELLQRMESPDARWALALPAHRQFIGLVLRFPTWVRQRLGVSFLLVQPVAQAPWKVGIVLPEAYTVDG